MSKHNCNAAFVAGGKVVADVVAKEVAQLRAEVARLKAENATLAETLLWCWARVPTAHGNAEAKERDEYGKALAAVSKIYTARLAAKEMKK